MALILPDLTSDLSTTTGTGTYTLAGTPTDYAPFPFTDLADGTTFYYRAIGVDPATLVPNGDGAEIGLGTLGGTGTTLARTTIHRSTNSDAAVDWAAGTRLIEIVRSAEGTGVFLQPGGTPGTDEVQVSHDGSKAIIESKDGNIQFAVPFGSGNYDFSGHDGQILFVKLGGPSFNLYADSGGWKVRRTAYFGFTDSDAYNTPDTTLRSPAAKVLAFADGAGTVGATTRSIPLSPSQITGDQNDYAPGVARFYRLSTDASRTITGLSVGQVDGQECEIWNVGAQDIVLAHDSASSSAANQFLNSTGASITLGANEMAYLRWFSAEQSGSGAWRVVKG